MKMYIWTKDEWKPYKINQKMCAMLLDMSEVNIYNTKTHRWKKQDLSKNIYE